MIVYTRKCMCQSKEKARVKELKTEYRDVQVRIVTRSKEWMAEADRYGVALPFYTDGSLLYDFYSGETL